MSKYSSFFATVKQLEPSITLQVANKDKASTFHTEWRKTKGEGRRETAKATVTVLVDLGWGGGGMEKIYKKGWSSIFFFLLHGFD